jgi:hypothetical protein
MIDLHQHLWPPALIEALRGRSRAPRLRGWTLLLDGEPDYQVDPADHDPGHRDDDPSDRALVSLSSPLGLEDLPPDEAAPLLAAWHDGAAALPARFGAWAATTRTDPDLDGLRAHLDGGFAGLQVPAGWLATPAALTGLAPVLAVCEAAGRPVLVHPGPVAAVTSAATAADPLPSWWPAVVDYPAQLSAAWWSWHEAGRALLPRLRICFVAGAGLAPLQHERHRARGGTPAPADPGVFVETSSHGPEAVDALVRALGIDALVRGSDRPYARPQPYPQLGAAGEHAVDVTNPRRLLSGGR